MDAFAAVSGKIGVSEANAARPLEDDLKEK
jgi:hypothetical protein